MFDVAKMVLASAVSTLVTKFWLTSAFSMKTGHPRNHPLCLYTGWCDATQDVIQSPVVLLHFVAHVQATLLTTTAGSRSSGAKTVSRLVWFIMVDMIQLGLPMLLPSRIILVVAQCSQGPQNSQKVPSKDPSPEIRCCWIIYCVVIRITRVPERPPKKTQVLKFDTVGLYVTCNPGSCEPWKISLESPVKSWNLKFPWLRSLQKDPETLKKCRNLDLWIVEFWRS